MVISLTWKKGYYHLWLIAVVVAPLFSLISRAFLRLDTLFFPALRKVKVLLEIEFKDLITSKESTRQTLFRVFKFAGLKFGPVTWKYISKELNSRNRRSHSNYPLEYFNISSQALMKDFNFYLDFSLIL